MKSEDRERVVAARVSEGYILALHELVKRGAFADRSAAIRRAVYNLLVATKALQEQGADPYVGNRTPTPHPFVIPRTRQLNVSDSHHVTKEDALPAKKGV